MRSQFVKQQPEPRDDEPHPDERQSRANVCEQGPFKCKVLPQVHTSERILKG